MLFYVLRRVLILIPVYLGLTLSTFTLIRLVPGDAVEIMMGEKAVDPAMHAQALQRLGLDLPLPVQYWHYLTNILQGNFGESFRTRTPVLQDFFQHFVPTVELAFCAILIASILGITMGVIAALRRGSWQPGRAGATLSAGLPAGSICRIRGGRKESAATCPRL